MSTFQSGNVKFELKPNDSLEVLACIADFINRCHQRQLAEQQLRAVRHLHKFGIGYKCEHCGLDITEYHLQHPNYSLCQVRAKQLIHWSETGELA